MINLSTHPNMSNNCFFFVLLFLSPSNMMCRGSGRAIPLLPPYNNYIQLYVTHSHAFHSSVYVHTCILIWYEKYQLVLSITKVKLRRRFILNKEEKKKAEMVSREYMGCERDTG